MEETNSSLVFIEKNIDNEDISITDDYEMLNSNYPDEIKEIKNNKETLYFLLKLKHEIEINNSTMDLLHNLKLDDLLNCKNDNCLNLPYWIKIFYSKKNKLIKISCYVYWFKYEENIKNELQEKLSDRIDKPILYNIIEESKNVIENSLKDEKILNDLLKEIVELKAMKEQTIDNFLLFQTKANEDIIEDFYYDEIKFSYPSNNTNKHKKNENNQSNNKKKENMKNINNENESKNKKENNYDTFQSPAQKNEKYISILNKLKHKPIIIEFIFSFIRKNPLPIFILIEKDKKLKNDINSFFISTKKNNYLSNAINYNINAIQNFKLYQDIFVGQDICYVNIFAEYIMENNAFPSFINFKTKYILKKIYGEDKAYSTFNNISEVYDLNNIHYKLIKNVKNI